MSVDKTIFKLRWLNLGLLATGTLFTSLNVAKLGINMVAGVLCARALGPRDLGYWNIFGLMVVYIPVLHFGVINGLGRELPFWLGAGQKEKAYGLAATSNWWSWWLTIATLTILIPWALFWHFDKASLKVVALAYAVMAPFSIPVLHYRVLYRTAHEFVNQALKELIVALAGLALIVMVWWYGLTGMALRGIWLALAGFLILRWRSPIVAAPHYSKENLIRLGKIGFPIFGSGCLYTLIESLDIMVLAIYAGAESVGLYALAKMVQTAFGMMPMSVATMVYPRMCARFGAEKKIASLAKMTGLASGLLLLLLIPMAVVVNILLDIFVPMFLPKFINGLGAAHWMTWAMVARFSDISGDLFATVRRMDLYFVAILAGGAAFFAALWAIKDSNNPTLTVAQAVFVRGIITSSVMVGLSLYLFRKESPIR